MISKKTKYGLKALLFLGKSSNRGPVLVSEIAEKELIPLKFLEAILLDLKNHGILQSKKGKGGGYFLNRSPEQILMGEVVRVLEGPLAPLPCVSQTSYERCEECIDEAVCGIRMIMKEVRDATAKILDGTTLKRLLDQVDQAQSESKGILTYTI